MGTSWLTLKNTLCEKKNDLPDRKPFCAVDIYLRT